MNFIREMVSQKKIRFKDNNFNLDLSYITPRIIAMAYPASGMESLYRNKMHDVKEFLDSRHPNKYYVINTSNRKYDYSNFHNRVIDIDWPNHHPCRFYYFAKLALETAKLLLDSDPETVIVVHCLGGKGRTGSLIGCLLYMSGQFSSIDHANTFYKERRGVNVTYPSQIRYMVQYRYYFLFGKRVIDCTEKTLNSVSIKSSVDAFFEGSIFNLTFSDYKDKKKILYERSFEALFEKEEKNNLKSNNDDGKGYLISS
jgi:phosphatidylinositol-3,4,5-trisphosphate 3-phosphatase/dual-specificity protein phosphatase PTEN